MKQNYRAYLPNDTIYKLEGENKEFQSFEAIFSWKMYRQIDLYVFPKF